VSEPTPETALLLSAATIETATVVPTRSGDLGAVVRIPARSTSLPGVVLVDGSGDGDRFSWGLWPEVLADAGSVVLRHDKPGCGGSPGHWTDQTMEDRARESLGAIDVLRDHPYCNQQPVGLYGISQGGWVALLAAALEPSAVDFVVCHSGPGTTPAEQERDRTETSLQADGHDGRAAADAMAWFDRRATRLMNGEQLDSILSEQEQHRAEQWYETLSFAYDSEENLRFLAGIYGFDPTAVMPLVRCPVLAMFGGADPVVPAQTSLRAFAEHLPPNPQEHGFVVFPGADHGLFISDPDAAIPRRDQLAPAYLPTIEAFLAARAV